MSRSRSIGTAAETAVVNYLKTWFPYVERRAGNGAQDRGDIAGIPGWVIEVKACAKMTLAAWMAEAKVEAANAKVARYAVWHKRRGKGSPGQWYVTMPGDVFAALLEDQPS